MRNFLIHALSLIVVFLLGIGDSLLAQFQNVADRRGSAQRRQLVDGLIQNLVDTRVNLNSSANLQSVPPASVTPKMREARQKIQELAAETSRLISSMRNDERYARGLRLLLGEAIQFKADADFLVRRSYSSTQISQIANEFAQLDQNWRTLQHHFSQTPDISNLSSQYVNRIAQRHDQLDQIFEVSPQIDRNTLTRELAGLDSGLSHLMQDIRLDLANDPRQNGFMNAVFQLQSRVKRVGDAVDLNRPHNELVGDYKRFRDAWLPVQARFRVIVNQYIQRNVTRINDANNRVQELLWMSPAIDGNEILYLARVLRSNVNQFSDGVTLTQLLAIPDVSLIIPAAQEFYGLTSAFEESVISKTDLQELIRDYRKLESAWNTVETHVVSLNSPDIANQLAGIDNSLSELRAAMGMRPAIDYQQTVELVNELDYNSNELRYDLRRNVGQSPNYTRQFRDGAVNAAQQFQRSTHALYDSVVGRQGEEPIRQQFANLEEDWNSLRGFISQINPRDRDPFMQSYQNIVNQVARLKVLYTY